MHLHAVRCYRRHHESQHYPRERRQYHGRHGRAINQHEDLIDRGRKARAQKRYDYVVTKRLPLSPRVHISSRQYRPYIQQVLSKKAKPEHAEKRKIYRAIGLHVQLHDYCGAYYAQKPRIDECRSDATYLQIVRNKNRRIGHYAVESPHNLARRLKKHSTYNKI